MTAFPKQQVDLAEFDGAFEIPVPRWNQGKDVFLGSLLLNNEDILASYVSFTRG